MQKTNVEMVCGVNIPYNLQKKAASNNIEQLFKLNETEIFKNALKIYCHENKLKIMLELQQ